MKYYHCDRCKSVAKDPIVTIHNPQIGGRIFSTPIGWGRLLQVAKPDTALDLCVECLERLQKEIKDYK